MKNFKGWLLLLVAVNAGVCVRAHGQGARFEPSPLMSTTNIAGIGTVVTPAGNAQVQFCQYPANGVPCTNKALTYTDPTLGFSCSGATQVVLDGTSRCVGQSDALGNWGVWVAGGTYSWTYTFAKRSYGPYTITVAAPSGSGAVPGRNGLNSGGQVAWVSGYTFRVSLASYYIAGAPYQSPQTTVTLGVADVINPRIDVIAVDTSGAVVVVPGTAAPQPSKPAVSSTQLELSFVLVGANTTQPAAVATTDIYHENAGLPNEWTTSITGAGGHISVSSMAEPLSGIKSIDATNAVNGDHLDLTPSAPVDLSTRSYMVLNVRPKAAFSAGSSIVLGWYNGAVALGSAVFITDGSLGFNSSSFSYQQIVIPLTMFGLITPAEHLAITASTSSGSIGFYVDDVTLQSGVIGTAPAPAAFTSLSDTPKSYAGQSLKVVRVAADETGLDFGAVLGTAATHPATDFLASTTVLPGNEPGAANNFLTGFEDTTGIFSKARPTCANLSDASTGCSTTVGTAATHPATDFAPAVQSHPMVTTYNGTFAADVPLLRFPVSTSMTVPINCTGARLELATAATASTTFSLQKCTGAHFTTCTEFGTAVVGVGGYVATFTCAASTAFVGGTDSFQVLAPHVPDATAAGLGATIVATW